jgi:hypothetical protein
MATNLTQTALPTCASAPALWCDGTEDDNSIAASFAAAPHSSLSPSPSLVVVESEHEFALPHLIGTTSLISPLHVAEARLFVERAASRTRNCIEAQPSSLVRWTDAGNHDIEKCDHVKKVSLCLKKSD